MPQAQQGEVKGKVLQVGQRQGLTATNKPYAYSWVQLMDQELREIVEVTADVLSQADPFSELRRGQFVALPVGPARVYHGMVNYSLFNVVSGELDDTSDDDSAL